MSKFVRTFTYDLKTGKKEETMEPLSGPLALETMAVADRNPGKPVVGWQHGDHIEAKLLEDCK